MGSLSGLLHRPLSVVAAVAVAAVSSDFPDRFGYSGSFDPFLAERESTGALKSSEEQAMWKSGKSSSSSSGYTIAARVRGCKTEFDGSIRNYGIPFAQNHMLGSCRSTVGSVPALQTVYHYAKLTKSQQSRDCPYPILSSSSDVLYRGIFQILVHVMLLQGNVKMEWKNHKQWWFCLGGYEPGKGILRDMQIGILLKATMLSRLPFPWWRCLATKLEERLNKMQSCLQIT